MKTIVQITIGVIALTMISSPFAQAGKPVTVSSRVQAGQVAADGGRVYLSAVNINGGAVNGRISITSQTTVDTISVETAGRAYISTVDLNHTRLDNLQYRSTAQINGRIHVSEGQLLNLASGSINGVDVSGDVTLDLSATVQGDVEVGTGGTALIGAVNIDGQDIYGGAPVPAASPADLSVPQPSPDENLPVVTQTPDTPSPEPVETAPASGRHIPFDDIFADGYRFRNRGGNDLNGHCAWFAEQLTRLPGGRTWTIGSLSGDKERQLRAHVRRGDGFYRGGGTPRAGNTIIFNGTRRNPYGHVAVINEVLPGNRVRLTESNAHGRFTVTHTRIVNLNDPAIMGFLCTRPHGV